MMTAQETLGWAKERALQELDAVTAYPEIPHENGTMAITSMISDLGKHPDLAALRQDAVMTSPFREGEDEVRAWIRGLKIEQVGA